MAKKIGIPVDNRDKEERDEGNMSDDGNIQIFEDVDVEFMRDAPDDVDDAHDDEMIIVYDKENHVIVAGKLFPSMGEFRMCFKTCAVKKEFDAKT
jgi:ssDNA-specific exonuclease RecJ